MFVAGQTWRTRRSTIWTGAVGAAIGALLVAAPDATGAAASSAEGSPAVVAGAQASFPPGRQIFVTSTEGGPATRLTELGSPRSALRTRFSYAEFAAWSSDGLMISFARANEISSDWPRWVMNADGSELHRFSKGLHVYSDDMAAWSPTSQILTFAARPRGRPRYSDDVYTYDVATRELTNLTKTPDVSEGGPQWSPDGTEISYQRRASMWVMDVDGGNPTKSPVLDGTAAREWAWSPDWSHLAYVAYDTDDDDEVVFVTDPQGQTHTQLTPSGEAFYDVDDLRWSPDGSHICFFANRNSRLGDFIVDIAGEDLIELSGGGLSWSPDGSQSAFMRSFNLFVGGPEGQDPSLLVREGFEPAWSPDGDSIAYTSPAGSTYIADLTSLPRPRVTRGETVQVTGKLRQGGRGLVGAEVLISFLPDGEDSFHRRSVVTTGDRGRFSAEFTARRSGTWRAYYKGTADTSWSSWTVHMRVVAPR